MLNKHILRVLVLAMMFTLVASVPVMASPSGGSVVLTNSMVTPFYVVNPPEGGTWNYGTEPYGSQKHVWSYYKHPSKKHHATAIIGSQQGYEQKPGGQWAKADAYGAQNQTGYAYYGVDE